MMLQSRFSIAAEHPSLAGHFPGNPVVPGVVIIDAICQQLQQHDQNIKVGAIANIKFLKPLRAGVQVELLIKEKKPGVLEFTCSNADGKLVNGLLHT